MTWTRSAIAGRQARSFVELTPKRVGDRYGARQSQHDTNIKQLRSETVGRDCQRRGNNCDYRADEAVAKTIALSVVGIIKRLGNALKDQPHITQVKKSDDDPDYDCNDRNRDRHRIFLLALYVA